MIALIDNDPIGGEIEIMLFQDRAMNVAEALRSFLELKAHHHHVFILEADSIETLLKTHGVWFSKLCG